MILSRRRSPRRRAALVALLVALAPAGALAACGDDAPPEDRAAPPPADSVREPALAIGLTEANANLLVSPSARPAPAGGVGPWRDRLTALHPRYLRLLVDWSVVQPRAGAEPDWDAPDAGCLRALPPCAPYAGMRDRLRAIASQQRDGGGFEVVVQLYNTPAWAGEPPSGCERGDVPATARAPRAEALPAYRRLVGSLLALGRAEGVELRWWAPWNEPDHPTFLAPQRARCSTTAPSTAVPAYVRLVRALGDELRAAGGDRRIVLGELAGYAPPRPDRTGTLEFIADLPRAVVCDAAVWAQHLYVTDPRRSGSNDLAGEPGDRDLGAIADRIAAALDAHGCPRRLPIWITETGQGGGSASRPRATDAATLRDGCRRMHDALTTWWRHPRVAAAFQYSFREDDQFPYGLVDTALTRAYPAYEIWRAWAGDRAPDGPPPPLPAAC